MHRAWKIEIIEIHNSKVKLLKLYINKEIIILAYANQPKLTAVNFAMWNVSCDV